jgi:4,5-DOPA dioxygenase extradiol
VHALPTLFVSHGSPMHALVPGEAGAAWQRLAARLPRPRAVLAVSAHWETGLPMLASAERHSTLHDYAGFPAPLYDLRYDAPGAPEVAREAAALLQSAGHVPALNGCRGLDHGAWVPLRWMYPQADVPVVELSVQTALGTAHHLRLGAALAPLARDGVLVLGSGHVTHNLHDWMRHRGGAEPLPYARDFADWLGATLATDDRDALLDYRARAPGAERAHPTEEHFLPIFVALGAAGPAARAERVHSGWEGNALSMDAWLFETR